MKGLNRFTKSPNVKLNIYKKNDKSKIFIFDLSVNLKINVEHFTYHQIQGYDRCSLGFLYSNYPAGRFLELDTITLKTNEKYDELKNLIIWQHDILNSGGIIYHSLWY